MTNMDALGLQAAAFLGLIEQLQTEIAELRTRLEAADADPDR